MPSQVSKLIHSNWQKKHTLTKVKMDKQPRRQKKSGMVYTLLLLLLIMIICLWCRDSCVSGHPCVQALNNF